MKKTFITAGIISAALAATPAFAKTEGNYIGLDLINTEVEVANANDRDGKEDNTSFGVNYKYAFNFNNFFVAPGVFYNHNATRSNDTASNTADQLRYSYGVKVDLGYDVTDKFAVLATLGHSENRESYDTQDLTREAFIYGIGLKYDVGSNVDVNLGYELSQYGKSNDLTNSTDGFSPNYRVAKIGVSYNF